MIKRYSNGVLVSVQIDENDIDKEHDKYLKELDDIKKEKEKEDNKDKEDKE